MVKNKYDTLDNFPGEVLTDIRALADQFLIAFPNINKHFWRRCQGERWFAEITLSLTTSLYLYFYLFLSFYILYLFSYLMENQDSKSIYQFATPSETDLLPWESSQPIQTSQYKLSSRLIAMIQNLSFSGKEDENPYLHIRDFEQTCDCLRIEGISDKTLRWKLFPFSLRGEARQWYSQKVSQQQGEWGVLRANFCLDFYSLDRIADLRLEVLSFKQKDNETLGKSWKRFSDLLESGPNLNLEDPVLLFHFFRGLQKNHKQMLHTMSRGSFFRIPTDEARVILDRILEAEMDNTLHDETYKAEVDTLPNSSSTLAIPSSEPQEEEIPPPDFMLDIESDLFANFGNISNYHSIDKPQNG